MSLTYKAIDTMKITRDTNSVTNANKIAHCQALARDIPALTHITFDGYTNNPSYHSAAYVQEWVDAIRGTGKSIWWRPLFTGASGTSTLEELGDLIVEGIDEHPEWFATGDIFEMMPETSPYTGILNGTAQDIADWNAWIRDMITEIEGKFTAQGKTISAKIVSLTDGYVKSGVLEPETVTAMGNQIAYDSYPWDSGTPYRAAKRMLEDIDAIHALYPSADLILSEVGLNNTRAISDSDQREVLRFALNTLAQLPYIKGLNYWVSYGGPGLGGYTNLYQNNSLTEPRPATRILNEFFSQGRCISRMAVL